MAGKNKKAAPRQCEICSADFRPRLSQLRAGQGRYCSPKCAGASYANIPRASRKPAQEDHSIPQPIIFACEQERFDAKWEAVTETGCWIWTAGIATNGYGRFWDFESQTTRPAHRWLFERLRGPVPIDLELDHKCRVRCCVNPDHLEVVTHRENVMRGVGVAAYNTRKTHCPYGHEYSAENTYLPPRGVGRTCRTCQRSRW